MYICRASRSRSIAYYRTRAFSLSLHTHLIISPISLSLSRNHRRASRRHAHNREKSLTLAESPLMDPPLHTHTYIPTHKGDDTHCVMQLSLPLALNFLECKRSRAYSRLCSLQSCHFHRSDVCAGGKKGGDRGKEKMKFHAEGGKQRRERDERRLCIIHFLVCACVCVYGCLKGEKCVIMLRTSVYTTIRHRCRSRCCFFL